MKTDGCIVRSIATRGAVVEAPGIVALAILLLAACSSDDGPTAPPEPLPDDFVAEWPQETAEPGGYDENGPEGPLRLRANGHDAWHPRWHQPYYGGRAAVTFTDLSRSEVASYRGWGDSTFFSGIYLASQAMRYHVTGDPDAEANAIRVANALSGHLHVTGTRGYIARYRAPRDSIIWEGDDWCEANDRCFAVNDGPFAGDFWWGSTSRDQFIGWMLGMTMAHELVDDEALRETIRADVFEVVDTLIDNGWTIIAQDGNPTGTAPEVLDITQIAFLVQAYHVTGDERMRAQLGERLLDQRRAGYEFQATFQAFNRYEEYFGNNLTHIQWFQLLRLGRVYFSPEDHAWFVGHFGRDIHTFTRLSHNAWFNSVFMTQGGWVEEPGGDPYRAQLEQDLGDLRDAPNTRYVLPARDPSTYELDPVSTGLADFSENQPWLQDLFDVSFDPQALEAFPVPLQCSDHFLWERNPFRIDDCGYDEPREAGPGADYLIAYWTAAYHRILERGQ